MLLLKLTNFLHSIELLILHQKGETRNTVLSLTHPALCVCVSKANYVLLCHLAELGFTVTKLELDAQTHRNQFHYV
jgi:hypothetical protein